MENKEELYEIGKITVKKKEEKNLNIIYNKKNINEADKLNNFDLDNKSDEESKNKCLRCLNCFSIPLLLINYTTHAVKINCNQGHNISMDIKDYIEKGYMNNFYNQICSQCKSKIDILTERKNYFCKECNEIFCRTCIKNHNLIFNNNNDNQNKNIVHHFINLEKYDTTCILHNETYGYFCLDCKMNICQYCFHSKHKLHKVVDLDDINLKRKEIKKIKENYSIEKENLKLAGDVFKKLIIKIKKEIKKIFEYKEAELKFKENIIKIYEKKIDNYNIIKNIKNLLFNNCLFVIDNKSSSIEQLNYFYDYLNKDYEKINKKELIKKESNSSIISKLTNKYTSENDINYIKNKINIEVNNEILNKTINDDKIEENKNKDNLNNKVKSYDKTINKIKIKKIDKIDNKNIRYHKKRKTVQMTNIDSLKNNYNKLIIDKKENKINNISDISRDISSDDIKINSLLNSDDLIGKNKKINKKMIENHSIRNKDKNNIIQSDKIEVNKIKSKKSKIKKIVKKVKKKFVKKDYNNTSESESNAESNRKLNIKETILFNKSKNNINFQENIFKNIDIKIKQYDNKEIENRLSKKSNKNDDIKENKIIKNEIQKEKISNGKKIFKDNNNIFDKENKKEANSSNNTEIEDNNIKDLLMKKLKIIKPENNKKNKDLIDSYRHKKIVNQNNSKNISYNFQINHSVVEFYSYGNLYESLREKKKRIQILYKIPSFELKKSLLNNSYSRRNNSFSYITSDKIKSTNYINNEINKNLTSVFNNENVEMIKNEEIKDNKFTNKNKDIITRINKSNEKNNNDKNINKVLQPINNNNRNCSNSSKAINSIENTPIKDSELYLSDGMTLNDFKTKSLRLTIKEYENSVFSILEINSSIFAVGFLNGEIDIYEKNDIIFLFSIEEHNSRINNMFLLKEPNTILSSSFDYTMKKIKIIEEKKTYIIEFIFEGYNNIIYKGIEIYNDYIISISFGGEIVIWRKITNKSYLNINKYIIQNEELYDIIEINKKSIAISTNENLYFFNINNNSNHKNELLVQNKKILNLDFKQRNNMILINNNILGLLLKNEICLIDVAHKQIISKTKISEGKPETIILMKNKTILISISNYNIKDYDEDTKEKNCRIASNKMIFMQYEMVSTGLMFLIKKEENSDKINVKDFCRITSMSEFNNGIILFSTSGMEDNKICGSISAFDY